MIEIQWSFASFTNSEKKAIHLFLNKMKESIPALNEIFWNEYHFCFSRNCAKSRRNSEIKVHLESTQGYYKTVKFREDEKEITHAFLCVLLVIKAFSQCSTITTSSKVLEFSELEELGFSKIFYSYITQLQVFEYSITPPFEIVE